MLHRNLCENCGGNLEKVDELHYACQYCDTVYTVEKIENYADKLSKLLDDAKLEMISKARKNLYSAITEAHLSSEKICKWSDEIKKYLPDDFAANFYEAFCTPSNKDVAKIIRNIDVDEHYESLEPLINFIIKSLEKKYIADTKNLIDRAYHRNNRDFNKYNKYLTMLEAEAEKLQDDIYVTECHRDAFIAYSSRDEKKALELVEELENQGFKCFISIRNLRHGAGSVENYDKALKEAMDNCTTFVFVSSTNSRSFECDALKVEIRYLMQKDTNNAPREQRNNYLSIERKYKVHRVEYRIEESTSKNAADDYVDRFFDGYERVTEPAEVANRIAEHIMNLDAYVPDAKPTVVNELVATSANTNVAPLLKRAFMFLEDGDWKSADEYCEKVLDQDPENAQAYLGKLMAELKVKKQDDLKNCAQPFDKNGNYQKVLRFADKSLKTTVTGYIETINNRRLDGIYANAVSSMKTASTINHYEKAISTFETIKGWKNADDLIKECQDNIKKLKIKAENDRKDKILNDAKAKMNSESVQKNQEAIADLKTISGWKNADDLIKECQDNIKKIKIKAENDRKDKILNDAKAKMNSESVQKNQEAIADLKIISGWKNADDLIKECQNNIEKLKIEEEKKRAEQNVARKKAAEERRLEAQRKVEIARKEAERIAKKKRNKKIIIVTIIFFAVALIAFLIILFTVIIPNNKYNKAISLMESGNTVEAYELFISLGEYKDSADKAKLIYDKYKAEKIKNFEVGDYVLFGSYEQDNNLSNGKEDIEWLVLDVQDGKALLISKYALDCKRYNIKDTGVTWETCSLREWLNNDFMNAAFSAIEQANIPAVTVSDDKNPKYDTNPGNSTQDKIFLLSIHEVEQYFASGIKRKCKPTEYVIANNAYTNNGNCWWWLRSPGYYQGNAACVMSYGSLDIRGFSVTHATFAVRPAMWINLEP